MPAEIATIDSGKPDSRLLRRAAGLIAAGEVLVCPTDTGYAFAANALDEGAIARVFRLKGRSFTNPVHVAVRSIEDAERYAEIDETARHIAEHFLPGALTMVLPRKEIVPDMLVAGLKTVGIRIPDNRVILNLAGMTRLPLTTTSANISGRPTPYTVREIIQQIGDNISDISLILDQGTICPAEVSTIVDLTVSPPRLLRQGRIIWEEIQKVLQKEGIR
ncbi:L-threonylcarbamoyladenylate synthase [Chloroflexota bacterium]